MIEALKTRNKLQHTNYCVQVTELGQQAGHLFEYCITIDNQLAIRHACLNEKMAKRSASEEFRDMLEAFVRSIDRPLSQEVPKAPVPAPLTNQATNSSSSARPAARPKHAANLVLCSEDENDDDDSEDDFSESSDWEPESKPANETAASESVSTSALIKVKAPALNHNGGWERLPYNLSSESTGTDDARFRATMRSLFTPDDDLCAGINSLRGSLKYTGAAETKIVENVKATIKMERLREGIFEVRVAVNDVIYYVASERTKPDACNAAIDGVLGKLNNIRRVWAQLLHFFHMKWLSSTDDMDTFHSLRLANIANVR